MAMTQTLEISDDRRITVEVPREIKTGQVILTFTPATEAAPTHPCPICAKNLDENGDYRLWPKTIAALRASREETSAMKRGEIPARRFSSFKEMWEDLNSYDADDMSDE